MTAQEIKKLKKKGENKTWPNGCLISPCCSQTFIKEIKI